MVWVVFLRKILYEYMRVNVLFCFLGIKVLYVFDSKKKMLRYIINKVYGT